MTNDPNTTIPVPETGTYRYEYLENIEPGTRGGKSLAIFERYGEQDAYQPGDKVRVAYFGTVDADGFVGAAWTVYQIHNRDDRPTGSYCRSLSNGDIVRVWQGNGEHGDLDVYLALQDDGFVRVDRPESVTLHPERRTDADDRRAAWQAHIRDDHRLHYEWEHTDLERLHADHLGECSWSPEGVNK